jgi:hypothetical protein
MTRLDQCGVALRQSLMRHLDRRPGGGVGRSAQDLAVVRRRRVGRHLRIDGCIVSRRERENRVVCEVRGKQRRQLRR